MGQGEPLHEQKERAKQGEVLPSKGALSRPTSVLSHSSTLPQEGGHNSFSTRTKTSDSEEHAHRLRTRERGRENTTVRVLLGKSNCVGRKMRYMGESSPEISLVVTAGDLFVFLQKEF